MPNPANTKPLLGTELHNYWRKIAIALIDPVKTCKRLISSWREQLIADASKR
jgi:hypothetical protein